MSLEVPDPEVKKPEVKKPEVDAKSWSTGVDKTRAGLKKKGRGRRSGNEGDLVLVAERCGTVFRLQRVAIVIEIE